MGGLGVLWFRLAFAAPLPDIEPQARPQTRSPFSSRNPAWGLLWNLIQASRQEPWSSICADAGVAIAASSPAVNARRSHSVVSCFSWTRSHSCAPGDSFAIPATWHALTDIFGCCAQLQCCRHTRSIHLSRGRGFLEVFGCVQLKGK